MDRWVIDLGTARDNTPFPIREWVSFSIGECTGDVTLRVGKPSASAISPDEFNKVVLVGNNDYYLYITNTAQSGEELVIYIEYKKRNRLLTWL